MGSKNRQRRKEKARRRAAHARQQPSRPPTSAERSDEARRLRRTLWSAAGLTRGMSADEYVRAALALAEVDPGDVVEIAETDIEAFVACAWAHGWLPTELARHARRRDVALGRVVTVAIAVDLAGRRDAVLHPRWRADAEAAVTPARNADVADGWLVRALDAERIGRASSTRFVTRLVGLLGQLGRLPTVVPPPGSDPSNWNRHVDSSGGEAVDDAVLTKVRALLAQAESTPFEAEAETFTAKAQELMAKHSIDAALIWSQRGGSERPSSVRLSVDDPYANEKALLLGVVATSSRCKVVQHGDLGLYSVFGFAADLSAVELLYTSLLVQSQKAMQAEAATAPPGHRMRGAAFKRAFLFGYAGRIGERLESVNRHAEDDASGTPGAPVGESLPAGVEGATALLPVLVARSESIDDEIAEQIGRTKPTRLAGRSYDRVGWDRGGQAADRAELNPAVRPRPARSASLSR